MSFNNIMNNSINYNNIQPLKVNPSYKQKTCILNKNQNCAIKHVSNCNKLKKCSWCKQKCMCNKIKNKKFCKKYNYQNVLLKNMEHHSYIFYKNYFLPKFLKNPKLSRFNYPTKKIYNKYIFKQRYIEWLAHNKEFYSLWARMFASQNSPSVYDMGATMIYGNS